MSQGPRREREREEPTHVRRRLGPSMLLAGSFPLLEDSRPSILEASPSARSVCGHRPLVPRSVGTDTGHNFFYPGKTDDARPKAFSRAC